MATLPAGMSVVVAGDVTIDWSIARAGTARGERRNSELDVRAGWQAGGAGLVGAVVAELAPMIGRDQGIPIEVRSLGVPAEAVTPGDERFHHSYALWSPMEDSAWRVTEFLGLDRAADQPPTGQVPDQPAFSDVILLTDVGLGFRERGDLWPSGIRDARTRWILMQMSAPVARGALWEQIAERAERLVAVVSIEAIRSSDVHVSKELSWERLAQDLVWEMVHNPALNALSRCAHVVVSLGTGGALVLSAERDGPRARLLFDPEAIEDSWARERRGQMLGSSACLVAGIAGELMRDADAPAITRGVQRGLSATRTLHQVGYVSREAGRLTFPLAAVAADLALDKEPFALADVPDPAGRLTGSYPAGEWSILRDRHPDGLGDLARRTLVEGPGAALEGVPMGRFGRLLTVDRNEIEGFRSIGSLIREYHRILRPRRPLSIAVFGPPGAGKSFAVIEVAGSALPGRVQVLEFNLSQMNDPHDLEDALHQVRDVGLGGRLPLVFWDEFDSALNGEPLGWLRHFLSPMQDGAFREGQVTHPVGPALFVFAGGTSDRMEAFGSASTPRFRAAKGPDFVSRLKGFVDILGPDARDGDREADPYFVLRRAILLRSMLQRDAPQLFREEHGRAVLQLDPGLARAFLNVGGYRHGARSMESILAMSTLSGATRFERSCLPSAEQLGLHTESREFQALVQRLELEGEMLERLAEAAHVVYCAGMLADGHGWAQADREYLRRHELLAPFAARYTDGKPHPSLVAYSELPEEVRAQNRDLVRDIPSKLAQVGLVMLPARGGEASADLSEDRIEGLAQEEHERWMRARLEAGWCYGPERDDARRQHPALVPWSKLSEEERVDRYGDDAACVGPGELPEEQREKDRDLIRGIPRILAVAGHTIMTIDPGGVRGGGPPPVSTP